MDYSRLAFDQAPPLAVPLRFFLTAPLFGVLAAVSLMVGGPPVLINRWTPALLGLTHCLTIGFLSMTMCGALLQILPVVAGAGLGTARVVGGVLHALLTIGTLGLGYGLWSGSRVCLIGAMVTLGLAGLFMGATVLRAVLRVCTIQPTVIAIGGALTAFVATVGLGLVLVGAHVGAWAVVIKYVTNLHARFGLVGWVGVLVIGIGYQVFPMFQLTPPYPRWLSMVLIPLLAIALVASAIRPLQGYTDLAIAAGLAIFAVVTFWLDRQRRRRRGDVTLWCWRFAMLCLLLSVVVWTTSRFAAHIGIATPLVLGALYIVGFGTTVITGMLYKIVPFMIWLHLKGPRAREARGRTRTVSMAKVIPVRRMRLQFALHCVGVMTLLIAAYRPHIATYFAATLLAIAWVGLWLNLLSATRYYNRCVVEQDLEPFCAAGS